MKKNIILKDCYKQYTDELDKVCSPLETVRRFHERLAGLNLDILQEVRRIDNGRLDIPVYFSVCGRDAENIIGNKKQMGKGSTPEQAKASACMELGERFSLFAFMENQDNFIHDTWAGVKSAGYPVLELDKWLLSVHDETTGVDRLEKLIRDIPIRWVWASNLSRNKEKEVLLPFSWFYAINEFNGSAAGNSIEEAIGQGVAEIVERHVCAEVSHGRLVTPRIDSDSVRNPVARELLDKFSANGIKVYLHDFSLDTGIPTVAALCFDPASFPEKSEIVYTAGTSPDPEKSLIRALTEVAQLAGDFNSGSNYVASGLPKPLSMDEISHIISSPESVAIDTLPCLIDENKNIRVEVESCVSQLAGKDLEVFVVDITHPELDIPAIYTIVPGCHFRERARGKQVGLFVAKLIYEQIADLKECERGLEKMKAVLPQAYYLEFYLARNLMDRNLFDRAVTHLEKSLTMEPEDEDIPYIYSYLGDCLKELGLFDKAISAIEKGRAYDDERPDFHNILGVCYFKKGCYQNAIERFHRAVELNPSSAIDYANLGINYRKTGRNKEAVKYLQLAVSLEPGLDFAVDNLAELLV